MPRLDRVLAARRPAGVRNGFRGIAASKIEALQCEPVCHAFGGRATLKPDLIAAFCWEVMLYRIPNVGTVHDRIPNVGAVHVGRHVAFGSDSVIRRCLLQCPLRPKADTGAAWRGTFYRAS